MEALGFSPANLGPHSPMASSHGGSARASVPALRRNKGFVRRKLTLSGAKAQSSCRSLFAGLKPGASTRNRPPGAPDSKPVPESLYLFGPVEALGFSPASLRFADPRASALGYINRESALAPPYNAPPAESSGRYPGAGRTRLRSRHIPRRPRRRPARRRQERSQTLRTAQVGGRLVQRLQYPHNAHLHRVQVLQRRQVQMPALASRPGPRHLQAASALPQMKAAVLAAA